MAHQAFLQEREYLLNEYSQAVDSYQRLVLELKQTREDSISGTFGNLLAEADAAKRTLDCCRDRYQEYCTLHEMNNIFMK